MSLEIVRYNGSLLHNAVVVIFGNSDPLIVIHWLRPAEISFVHGVGFWEVHSIALGCISRTCFFCDWISWEAQIFVGPVAWDSAFSFQIPDLFVLAVLLWLRKLWCLTTFSSGNGRSCDDSFLGDLYTINFNYQNDVLQWERHDSCILWWSFNICCCEMPLAEVSLRSWLAFEGFFKRGIFLSHGINCR